MRHAKVLIAGIAICAVVLLLVVVLIWIESLPLNYDDTVVLHSSSDVETLIRDKPSSPLKVRIAYSWMPDSEFQRLLQEVPLESLSLANCTNIRGRTLRYLRIPAAMTELDISQSALGGDIGEILKVMPNLVSLSARGIDISAFEVQDAQNLRKLRRVDLTACSLNRNVMNGLSNLPALQWLDVSLAKGLTPDDISVLTRSHSLERLLTARLELNAKCLRQLCLIPTLRSVVLTYPRAINEADISAVAKEYPRVAIQYTLDVP